MTETNTSEEWPHLLQATLNGIRFQIKSVMGLSNEDFDVGVASAGGDLVARILHKKVLVTGDDWTAIVSITTTWKSREGVSRTEYSNMVKEIWPRYLYQVRQAVGLNLFREDVMVAARRKITSSDNSHQFYQDASESGNGFVWRKKQVIETIPLDESNEDNDHG